MPYKNIEDARANQRLYRKTHPQKASIRSRQYKRENPEKYKLWHRTSNRKYYQTHKIEMRPKTNAQVTVSNAIKRGVLVRPTQCSECGGSKRIQAHHYLGYAKEHRLDVVWLCESCHRKIHGK